MCMCLFEPLVMAQRVRRLSEAEQAACAPQLCDAFYLGKAKARQGKLLISDSCGSCATTATGDRKCAATRAIKAMAMLVLVRERGWGVRLWLLRAHSCRSTSRPAD